MSTSIQPITLLDIDKHANVKVGEIEYDHMAQQHIVPVTFHEFAHAACEYPIVFVKNQENDEFQSVIMTALKINANLSVINGQWQSHYMPHVISDYPFGLVFNPEIEDKVWIGIREMSSSLTHDKGDELFIDNKESTYLQTKKLQLIEHYQQEQSSKLLMNVIDELDLLVPQTLSVDIAGEQRDINGIYLIDEERLNGLSDEAFKQLRDKGLLAPIYHHLSSLNQINRLAKNETIKNNAK